MKIYKLNPLYWMSKYFGFGFYSFMKDIKYIEKKVGEKNNGN